MIVSANKTEKLAKITRISRATRYAFAGDITYQARVIS
jgi:hypothetical protein